MAQSATIDVTKSEVVEECFEREAGRNDHCQHPIKEGTSHIT